MPGLDRRNLLAGAAGAALLSGKAGSATAIARARRPNILLVMTDQEIGMQSYPRGLLRYLPGHRRLLQLGTSVLNYHVNTTPCSPSRSSIYTGLHTQHTGVYMNANYGPETEMSPNIPTIGTMLRKAGYFTAYKGKWHLSALNTKRNWNGEPKGVYPNTSAFLEPYGFADYNFNGEELGLTWAGYETDRMVSGDAALWIRDRPAIGGDPWFLAVNLINPHDIMFFDATGRQSETRSVKDLIAPVLRAPGEPLYAEDLGFPLPESFYKDDLSTKPEAHRAFVEAAQRFYGEMNRSDETSWLRFINYYYNCMRDLDQNLARIMWALETSGQASNTVIMFTADHGERAGAHGMRQKGGTMYREETNVPMIVVHPDWKGGRTTRSLMSSVDIVPTLLALAGCERSWVEAHYPDLCGVDVSAAIARPGILTERDRRGHLFNYAVMHGWAAKTPAGPDDLPYDLTKRRLHRGIHDGTHKWARYFAPAQHHTPERWEELAELNDLELYELRRDPNEISNLAHGADAAHIALMMQLNEKVNRLVATEIGTDNGSEYPLPTSQYNRLSEAM